MGGKQQFLDSNTDRSLRHRRFRRAGHDGRHNKRLFTPEIKKYLKSWLVRRRKNPYPTRLEKKELALKTGLTYIQICNWFANWRRKLKNASNGREHTWCNLIKDYNSSARGNVEQFSISSDDSIWEDSSYTLGSEERFLEKQAELNDHSYSEEAKSSDRTEEVLKYCKEEVSRRVQAEPELLARWLKSAASYKSPSSRLCRATGRPARSLLARHRAELDAAEALTALSSSWALVQPIN